MVFDMRTTWRVLSSAAVLAPVQALASRAETPDFSVTFDGVATLGLLVSALMVFLGYRLMIKPRTGATPGSKLRVGIKSFNLTISNAVPGVIFAAFGCVGMVAALWHLAK
jgi:hypothetical protein